MALDGMLLFRLNQELQSLIGGKINKIHQPSEHDLVLQIRGRGNGCKLLLSANPTYPRVYETDASFINPMEAPMFCMLMRKHCEGGVIEAIEQVGAERILRIRLRQRDELGDLSQKTIVIELMGRHSNIILLDSASQTIVDGIHHVTPAISQYRIVMPGSAYVAPPEQNKLNPFDATRDQFLAAIDAGLPAVDQLVARFSGVSPLAAKEIAHRASVYHAEAGHPEALWLAFQQLLAEVREGLTRPEIREDDETGKLAFAAYELTHMDGRIQSFDTVSACLASYYGDKAERDLVKQKTGDLSRVLQNEIGKNRKKIGKLEETIVEAKDADRYRKLGELLTASIYAIRKGDTSAEVVDFYDEEQRTVTIPLDPQLSPAENAQRQFRKYTKSKNSLAHAEQQLQEAQAETAYLEDVWLHLQTAGLRDIEEIRDELAEGGYVRNRGASKKKKKKDDKPQLICFTSSEGIPIYVGKNNKQNEYLTIRLASSQDTWLHTKDIPGSHVVIRSSSFGEQTLREAAEIAAYHSGARSSSNVPVDYTLIRNVHKPNGTKPGYVIFTNQRTLYVTPDENIIKSMPMRIV